MYLGIKVGPDNWHDKLVVSELDVQHVEIHFDFTYLEDYTALFVWMHERGIEGRLHASTPLPGGILPTLATADPEVRGASADLMRRTVGVAAQNGLSAVVVHPGSYRIACIHGGRVEIYGRETPEHEGARWVADEMAELAAYGRERGVEPLVETMPGREFAGYGPIDRTHSVDVGFVPYPVLRALGERGIGLCIDLAHLYTELMVDRAGRGNGLHGRVMDASRELAPYTRHLHLSTVTPPWNGTDGHSGFLEVDYARGAIPRRQELLSWLGLFGGRDVWVIPEPNGGAQAHLDNHYVLRNWLRGIE